jgi:monothiol glutaredoxin
VKPTSVRLFIKPGCAWCHEAMDWLHAHGVAYELLNVRSDPAARHEMFELTGQSLAPSIEVDGHVLADFGTDELEEWWREMEFDR